MGLWARDEKVSPVGRGLGGLLRWLSDAFMLRPPPTPRSDIWNWLSSLPRRASWITLSVMVLCGVSSCAWVVARRKRAGKEFVISHHGSSADSKQDAHTTDPSLLKKHSVYKSYTIISPRSNEAITYPSIRTFYRPHPQAAKLPTSPTPLPLLVFVHGLGGSVAQFASLLTSLVNVAPCLAIDLPGCGLSAFEPRNWSAYSTECLTALVAVAIDQYRDKGLGQEVILIGHSMGCSLAALLASPSSPLAQAQLMSMRILGLVAICPRAEPPTEKEVAAFKKLLAIPGPIFDLWRRWDRRGGTESASVARFVGVGAEEEVKKLQVRFNEQSKTPVWRRMARGILPDYSREAKGGMPGKETWSGLQVPVMLIAGEADKVTPAAELEKIAKFLGKTSHKDPGKEMKTGEAIVDAAAPVDTDVVNSSSAPSARDKAARADSGASLLSSESRTDQVYEDRPSEQPTHAAALKTTILPAPAAHALLYAPSTVRIVAGLIQAFLSSHIDPRLSLGWQLQYLTTEGKWDVKNLAKWQGVRTVSEPIPGPAPPPRKQPVREPSHFHLHSPKLRPPKTRPAPAPVPAPQPQRAAPVFRAMKTLREVDDVHSPHTFVARWHGIVRAVIDISHEAPVYDPHGLEQGGIEYHKFPTVSKLPPTPEEVRAFIALVDRLREELSVGKQLAGADGGEGGEAANYDSAPVIGVHCHYGYNRTGFFLVCYMVERLGFSLQGAIDEFELRRPPGIRHGHFIDTLFVRYCVGLKRAPTL